MRSFKLKLVTYFSLIALLPFAAAFSGLEAVTDQNETRRVDGTLDSGIRAALSALEDRVLLAEDAARDLARDPNFQRALAEGDRVALRRFARTSGVRVETGGSFAVGRVAPLAVKRPLAVFGTRGRIGRVIASVPVDRPLALHLRSRAGLPAEGDLAFVLRGRIVAASGDLAGGVDLPPKPAEITADGDSYRALASRPLTEPRGTSILVLTPQARIEASTSWMRSRLFIAMLGALLVIALVAYIEGRSIVRTLGRLSDAARGIAHGRFGDRVRVRGRDEFASLGVAFNEMADQREARMHDLEEERRRLRESTLRFGEALAATHDVEQLLRVIVETAVLATGAVRGELEELGRPVIQVGEERGPVALVYPLSAGRETFGTLVLYGEDFNTDQRETAGWLVGHAVIALSNARLHRTVEQQALVDSLTGLANRRLCTGALEKELARAQRFGQPLALVLADIDDFKRINDRWGHPTGDEVLKLFADRLRGGVREIDLAGRWGGEEFALVLPGTDLDGGRELAERIRDAVAEDRLAGPDGAQIAITASFGVASFPSVAGEDGLLAAADAALYEAKRSGKNCVAPAATVTARARA